MSSGRNGAQGPAPAKLILPGDVLIKAEKCAEEAGALLKLPLNTSHHNSRWGASLKDICSLDKTLTSLDNHTNAIENSIALMKTDMINLRMQSENCVDIVEILKRIENVASADN